ncbi:hypothetical protein DVH05_017339 [Phytophthora capsici]|nr:hypothetical protein DVH05_017339 [Phytophthora capsici]
MWQAVVPQRAFMTIDTNRQEIVEEQDSMKVCVRIRPLSSKENQEQTNSCIHPSMD